MRSSLCFLLTFTYIKTKIIDGDFMITETERLFLRELTKDDFSALYSVWQIRI